MHDDTHNSNIYGLSFPPQFIENLHKLTPNPSPVRALPPQEFANVHLNHILAHPPDHVLFPFLHGLEGDNEAQNMFFANNSPNLTTTMNMHGRQTIGKPHVPRYRGLAWVVCEDDLLESHGPKHPGLRVLRRKGTGSFSSINSSSSDSNSTSSSSAFDDDESDYEEDVGVPMEVDVEMGAIGAVPVDGAVRILQQDTTEEMAIHQDALGGGESKEDKHMHPVQHRPSLPSVPNAPGKLDNITTMDLPLHISASPSSSSSTESNTLPETPESAHEWNATWDSTTPIPIAQPPSPPASEAADSPLDVSMLDIKEALDATVSPPLLTSTFRPKELIRRVSSDPAKRSKAKPKSEGIPAPVETSEKSADDDGDWEFVPPKMPDGISLRNFGIQVPIYATLADIVVYSPRGASPNAIRLATRFQKAIERKRAEREGWIRAQTKPAGKDDKPILSPPLVEYNVFVLDANETEMRRTMPHLMMRMCKDGSVGDPASENHHHYPVGAHTDGTDGHVYELGNDDAGKDVGSTTIPAFSPNTVNFAQREKEEMRDLTKASEILTVFPIGYAIPTTPGTPSTPSVDDSGFPVTLTPSSVNLSTTKTHWDPRLGQVFLGNSNDVPLAPEVNGGFRHAAMSTTAVNNRVGSPSTSASPPSSTSSSPSPSSEQEKEEELDPADPFNYLPTNSPAKGFGYDICIECHDLAPFPSASHLRAAEDHLVMLDILWGEKWRSENVRNTASEGENDLERDLGTIVGDDKIPPRPPPNANAVIHLPFPSSPPNNTATMSALMPVVRFLEKWVQPVIPTSAHPPTTPASPSASHVVTVSTPQTNQSPGTSSSGARRWSSVSSSTSPTFPAFPANSTDRNSPPPTTLPVIGPSVGAQSNVPTSRTRSMTSPAPIPADNRYRRQTENPRTRPLKILLYSSDGYTESSLPAICLIMAIRSLSLPEAYLELQVAKKRSFFVYQADLPLLRRVEGRLGDDRERERERERGREREREQERERERGREGGVNGNGKRTVGLGNGSANTNSGSGSGRFGNWSSSVGTHQNPYVSAAVANSQTSTSSSPSSFSPQTHTYVQHQQQQSTPPRSGMGRPVAKSVSFPQAPVLQLPSPASQGAASTTTTNIPSQPATPSIVAVKGRPRASTSPWLPSLFGDHLTWFNDPRFDGSFPSRVLPFLYLGNLNHATNAYMLHALGITHVVSVGECALVPPPHQVNMQGNGYMAAASGYNSAAVCHRPGPGAQFIGGRGPGGQGSLWIEEREGRIKVLDIKGVCDDGIDTLEPQLEPICEWIDKARADGGQVLVHCRVGVSRSATVTIAYVMKHLNLPLVDAYLIVRSRRLSVLIQPNMRLLYNLCGWEIKLAKERAGVAENKLRQELARTLSWPYLAKEVHALNEKYLH